MLLKVKLSEIPADMLEVGDCFTLTTEKPTTFYTVLDKTVNGGSVGLSTISLPNSKREYWALDATLSVYLISPHVRG